MKTKRLLEICVDNFESAMAAIAGGAGRLELCSALSEGGLTPSVGFLKIVQASNPSKIPIYCMLRCRPGSDFVYSQEELDIMVEDAKILKQNGADGFVFGALKEDHDIDIKKCRDIIRASFPLPVTFHRAFDVCKNPFVSLESIIDIGFKRVLTSGQQKSVTEGVHLLEKLKQKMNDRIVIMPGCGINCSNLKTILEATDAQEVHASARVEKHCNEKSDITMSSKDDERPIMVTDENIVRELISILNSY